MKRLMALVFFGMTSFAQAADLSLISSYLFDLALTNEHISASSALCVTAQTVTLCKNTLSTQPHACTIIARIAPELHISTVEAEPVLVATALAKLILDEPTQLQILCTLIQLVQITINTSPLEQLDNNANIVVLEVCKILEPFVKQQNKKRLIFWLQLGGGIAIGLGTIALLHKFYSHHQHTTQALQQKQTALAAQAAKLGTRLEALANAPIQIDEIAHTQKNMATEQRKEASEQRKLARETSQLRKQVAALHVNLAQATADTQQLVAQVQDANVRGIRIINRKLHDQRQIFDQGFKAMENLVAAELDGAGDASDDEQPATRASVSLKDLTDWINVADKGVRLIRTAVNPTAAVTALSRHHENAVKTVIQQALRIKK